MSKPYELHDENNEILYDEEISMYLIVNYDDPDNPYIKGMMAYSAGENPTEFVQLEDYWEVNENYLLGEFDEIEAIHPDEYLSLDIAWGYVWDLGVKAYPDSWKSALL